VISIKIVKPASTSAINEKKNRKNSERIYRIKFSHIKSSVADPDPGSGAFLTPGYQYGEKIWIRIWDPDPDPG
jgi:hypothetical protein